MKAYRNIVARTSGVLLLAVVFAVGSAATAEGALVLRLTEGASTVTIVDGGAGDANPADGAVTFIGSVGVFNLNVSTGLSKPVLPNTPNFASMDLNSVNVSNSAGTLVIELTDTDFLAMSGSGTLMGDVGGTTNGTAEFWAYKNESNVEFDTTGAAASVHLGPFDPIAFSGSASDPHDAIGAYSMTMIAVITHGAGEGVTSSFDFDVKNVPEPATLALFGIGLAGAAVAARRRKANR